MFGRVYEPLVRESGVLPPERVVYLLQSYDRGCVLALTGISDSLSSKMYIPLQGENCKTAVYFG